MARRIARFIKAKRLDVHRIADVGCGPATTLFALAPRLPSCAFDGFDTSRTVLRLDRQRARREGLRNLRFHRAEIPDLRVEGPYDLVICIATIHYVEDVRTALRRLHGIVRPGGFLIFNYPNRVQQGATRREARRDPVVKQRFPLVLAGKNLLTRPRIEEILGERPRSFWREVGEPPRWLNPCVVVPRR
jgi:SAM-dependent methyltransferase